MHTTCMLPVLAALCDPHSECHHMQQLLAYSGAVSCNRAIQQRSASSTLVVTTTEKVASCSADHLLQLPVAAVEVLVSSYDLQVVLENTVDAAAAPDAGLRSRCSAQPASHRLCNRASAACEGTAVQPCVTTVALRLHL